MAHVEATRGEQTRTRLLDITETRVLEKGFGATSIEELVAEAGISKNGFFYHFKDKNALAHALLERYLDREAEIFEELFSRADELSDDPLQSFLIAMRLLSEIVNDVAERFPACLVASIAYQERLFDKDVRELNARGVASWRRRMRERLEAVAELYPPRSFVDVGALADMSLTLIEGGFVLARALHEPAIAKQQLETFRTCVRLAFEPEPARP